jgi:hypothetical protein
VSPVEGGQFGLVQSLDDRKDGGIACRLREADALQERRDIARHLGQPRQIRCVEGDDHGVRLTAAADGEAIETDGLRDADGEGVALGHPEEAETRSHRASRVHVLAAVGDLDR